MYKSLYNCLTSYMKCLEWVEQNDGYVEVGSGGMGGEKDGWGVSMEAASHGKSSQQASQIPWCPASRPK